MKSRYCSREIERVRGESTVLYVVVVFQWRNVDCVGLISIFARKNLRNDGIFLKISSTIEMDGSSAGPGPLVFGLRTQEIRHRTPESDVDMKMHALIYRNMWYYVKTLEKYFFWEDGLIFSSLISGDFGFIWVFTTKWHSLRNMKANRMSMVRLQGMSCLCNYTPITLKIYKLVAYFYFKLKQLDVKIYFLHVNLNNTFVVLFLQTISSKM